MRGSTKEIAAVVLTCGAIFVVGVFYPWWRAQVDRNDDARADPHHIAGGLYFVGAPDVTSFLIAGPDGHALIGSGYENTAHKIADNIAQLGFDVRDVRVLLATGGRLDDAGGFAELQRASGAELWANAGAADAIAAGKSVAIDMGELQATVFGWVGITDYPAARVDHRVADGDIVRVGPLTFTAHVMPHAPTCTTWTFAVREGTRDFQVVHRCRLEVPANAGDDTANDAGRRADFEQSFRALRSLPVDIWLTSQGREYGRYRKFQASLSAADPVAPFVDREGYLRAIDDAEARLRAAVTPPPSQQ